MPNDIEQALDNLVTPHGSPALNILLLEASMLENALKKAETLPSITMSSRERGDLIMFGIGGFTPLDGFMNKADWQGVCDEMELKSGENDGLFWPIPITLSASAEQADELAVGDEVALKAEDGEIMGILTLEEKYSIDKEHECKTVFGTTDTEHPGVKKVMEQAEVNLAGRVEVFSQGEFPTEYAGIYMTPTQTREEFARKAGKKLRLSKRVTQCIARTNIWLRLPLKSVMV